VIQKDGFSIAEVHKYSRVLQENCLQSMQQILRCKHLKNLPKKLELHKEAVLNSTLNGESLYQCYRDIVALWSNEKIKELFEKRSDIFLPVPSTANYYFDNVERIAQENFQATPEDIFRVKLKTTGISELSFDVNDVDFTIIDVGGQRSERRKWIHCFEDISHIIFLAALDDYDLILEEDNQKNRLEESLDLFYNLTSSPAISPQSWILFLNKSDLFEAKIKKKPLSNYFEDITEEKGSNFEECCKYILSKYEERFKGKSLYNFVTCALDTSNCKKVFLVIKDNALANVLNVSY